MPTTIKKVKGKSYLYYYYYDPKEQKKKEVYCGLSNTSQAKSKALELELSLVKKNKKELTEKISEIETELKQLSSSTKFT